MVKEGINEGQSRERQDLFPPDSALIPLAMAWQRATAAAMQLELTLTAAELAKSMTNRVYSMFNTMAFNNGDHAYPDGFDLTPKNGQSPIDEALLVWRVGILPQDLPAARAALHVELDRWADTGLQSPNGGSLIRKDRRILLMPAPPRPPPPRDPDFVRATPWRPKKRDLL